MAMAVKNLHNIKTTKSTGHKALAGFFDGLNKCRVLAALSGRVKMARILPQQAFTVADWRAKPDSILDVLMAQDFAKGPMIVRSSAAGEDSKASSQAGAYESVLNVMGRMGAKAAIEQVMASYPSGGRAEDMIFVQPMLTRTRVSGVAFTCDPNNGAPYYVVDYTEDDDTTVITGGKSNKGRTLYAHHARSNDVTGSMEPVIALCRELQDITGEEFLDIEFGISADGALYLFQVRPLCLTGLTPASPVHEETLREAAALIQRVNTNKPYVAGKNTLLGNMPDWNPAEMIGLRPRPLALSMYKEMITDRIWAYQRDKYGYKNLRSVPLLYSLAGCPFIDVRASFYSFIPKMVPAGLSSRLVDYYIAKLEENPELHDKVEFDIVFSCYTPSTPEKIKVLADHGFSDSDRAELLLALRELTNRMTHTESGEWRVDRGKIDILKQRQKKIKSGDFSAFDKIFWYAEDCKRYGTLPFAGLARAAFVATQFLKSLVDEGVFTSERHNAFWQSLETIGGNLKRDLAFLDRDTFLSRYGHLRPGTYDILSESYEEAPDKYFDWKSPDAAPHPATPFQLTPAEDRNLQNLLDAHGLQHTSESLLRFFKAAIEGREYGKFVFSWSINEILKEMLTLAGAHGLTREDCSFVNFQTLLGAYSYSEPMEKLLARSIAAGREQYDTTLQISLPHLLRGPDDLWVFEQHNSTPNFITHGKVHGRTVFVDQNTSHHDLKDVIALITNADPGYDWILGAGIKGFITCYGGPNSHMAVRAQELGLPAVIGVGERLFQKWSQARSLEIDCAARRVTDLS